MTKWIHVKKEKPSSTWHVVIVTDGLLTCLAYWVNDPKKYYGDEMIDEDDEPLDIQWHEPHWKFVTEIGPFRENDECFGVIEDITHWMHLPLPPKNYI